MSPNISSGKVSLIYYRFLDVTDHRQQYLSLLLPLYYRLHLHQLFKATASWKSLMAKLFLCSNFSFPIYRLYKCDVKGFEVLLNCHRIHLFTGNIKRSRNSCTFLLYWCQILTVSGHGPSSKSGLDETLGSKKPPKKVFTKLYSSASIFSLVSETVCCTIPVTFWPKISPCHESLTIASQA